MAHTEIAGQKYPFATTIRRGVGVGLLGGFAEVVWIGLYSSLAGGNAAHVASGITATVAPGLAGAQLALPLGIAVHFGLAALLGVVVVAALKAVIPGLIGTWRGAALVLLALTGVWAVNFLLILPMVNPEFVTLVPLWASFASKLLFGLFAALALLAPASPAGRRAL